MKRVICLYRVSTVGQVDHDDIPMQRIACREYAATHQDWEIIDEISEKGVSGYKVSTNARDAIIEIKKRAMAKEFDVLLVFMFDRLGRRALRLTLPLLRRRGFDVLLTHAPARGIGDEPDRAHTGFSAFLRLMDRDHPQAMVHGRVHAPYRCDFRRARD